MALGPKLSRSYFAPITVGVAAAFSILAAGEMLGRGLVAHLHASAASELEHKYISTPRHGEFAQMRESYTQTRNHNLGWGAGFALLGLAGIYASVTRGLTIAGRRADDESMRKAHAQGLHLTPQNEVSWLYYHYLRDDGRLQRADQLVTTLPGTRFERFAKNDPHFG